MLNRSAKPSGLPRLRCKGARVHCSWTNLSGSPTQRRSALPVGAVGIAAKTAVGDIGPIRVGPVSVGAVGVRPVGVRPVGVITTRTAVGDGVAVHPIRAGGDADGTDRAAGVDGTAVSDSGSGGDDADGTDADGTDADGTDADGSDADGTDVSDSGLGGDADGTDR